MKLLEFQDDELNLINVCLNHFIDEQTQEKPYLKFTQQEIKNYHSGMGFSELEMHSDHLYKLSIAVRTIKKIHVQEEQLKQS
jgi:hypothetical protein